MIADHDLHSDRHLAGGNHAWELVYCLQWMTHCNYDSKQLYSSVQLYFYSWQTSGYVTLVRNRFQAYIIMCECVRGTDCFLKPISLSDVKPRFQKCGIGC
jgi:hypothetical protein